MAKQVTPNNRKSKKTKKAVETRFPTVNALVGEDHVVRCPKCNNPVTSQVLEYGLARGEYFYYVRTCNDCMVNVKYETTTDFTVIPTVKSVKSGKFKRAEKKKKLSFKKTVNIDDLGEDEF